VCLGKNLQRGTKVERRPVSIGDHSSATRAPAFGFNVYNKIVPFVPFNKLDGAAIKGTHDGRRRCVPPAARYSAPTTDR